MSDTEGVTQEKNTSKVIILYQTIFTSYVENLNIFRKKFLAFRKVSSGKRIISKFLMNHQVFDESLSFC